MKLSLIPCFAILFVSGCHSHIATSGSNGSDIGAANTSKTVPAAAPIDPATAGSISGIVHFKGTPPARIPIDMSMDPACSLAGENLTEQYIVKDGGLANVYVYVKSGLPASSAPAGTAPVKIDQKGCRFVPHVAAVQQGADVSFINSDPTMHNIHTVSVDDNPALDVSQGPGAQPQLRRFNTPEAMIFAALQQPPLDERLSQRRAKPFLHGLRPRRQFHHHRPPARHVHLGRRA